MCNLAVLAKHNCRHRWRGWGGWVEWWVEGKSTDKCWDVGRKEPAAPKIRCLCDKVRCVTAFKGALKRRETLFLQLVYQAGSVQERVHNSVQFSRLVVSDSLWPMDCSRLGLPVDHQLPEFTQNSCPLSWWCHPTLSSSVIPFSGLQTFPASGSSIFSHQVAKVLEPQLQHQSFQWIFKTDSFRMDWLDLLASKGLSTVFSNTTFQKHQFFGAQLSL